MKKTRIALLALFLLAFLPMLSHAQNFGGGILLAFNASQVDGDNFKGFNQAGLTAGGFLRYRLNDTWVLAPELIYEQLGSSAGANFRILRTHQISLPLLLNVTLPIEVGEDTHEVEFMAGPVGGLLLQATDNAFDITSELHRFDLRAVAGVGYRLGQVSAFLRYGYSVFPFRSGGTINQLFPLGGPYHNYVQIGLRFHLTEGR